MCTSYWQAYSPQNGNMIKALAQSLPHDDRGLAPRQTDFDGAASTHPSKADWRGAVQRPPWTTELLVRDACTSCGACIEACPEAILVPGPARTPVLDFNQGACTFCKACVEACDEPVFAAPETSPWDLVATVGPECFLRNGISCRSCADACDETAITFEPKAGGFGTIRLDTARCTGCGACLGICPASAITMSSNQSLEVAK